MHISVVGCGWLGQPLAQQLKESGHSIVATCRSEEKHKTLEQQGFLSHIYQLGDASSGDALRAIFRSSLLILNLPPGGRHIQAELYTTQMCRLISEAHQHGVNKLIFVSTTAVYGDVEGEVCEDTPLGPITASGAAHQVIELHAKNVYAQDVCILRLAGLVGEDRHPAKYLAGKKEISGAQQSVNLIHQQDVINAIKAIIQQTQYGQVLHLCADEHPSRQDYYTWACARLGLQAPEFLNEDKANKGKKINAQFSCKTLGLTLIYASPYDMLKIN